MIEAWSGDEAEIPALAGILAACVAGGASVNFLQPFSVAEAEAWWRAKLRSPGARRLLLARLDGVIRGTVILEPAPQPNQRHRAEISKMLVHPAARRRGLARALLLAAEEAARAGGHGLLTLDTEADSPARALYEAMGYRLAGIIPGYARRADGSALAGAAFFYKELASGRPSPARA